MTHAVAYTRHEAQNSDEHEGCDHDRIERTQAYGRGPYAIHVWHCPDCGLAKMEAYEP